MKHCLKVMISVLLLAALITSFHYPITASAAETTAPKVQGQTSEFRAVWFSFKDWQTYLEERAKMISLPLFQLYVTKQKHAAVTR